MTRGGYTEPHPAQTVKKAQRGVDSLSKRPATNVPSGPVYHHKVFADDQLVQTGDGRRIFAVPQDMDGSVLTAVEIDVTTVSSSGIVQVQLRRMRVSVGDADMLSTRVQVDANEFHSADAATAYVINTANDDVLHKDRIAIDVDAAGTNAKGLGVVMFFSAV